MTTYILAGGNDQESIDFGPKVAKECRELIAKRNIYVLANYFATEPERRISKHQAFEPWYKENFVGSVIEVAKEDVFLEQVKRADVIFFHGGLTSRLVENMKQYSDIERYFIGKIVIGSSAGAGWLSSLCWSMNAREIVKGSGIVNVACIAHYGSLGNDRVQYKPEDWERVVGMVGQQAQQEGLELVLIPEGEFVVFQT